MIFQAVSSYSTKTSHKRPIKHTTKTRGVKAKEYANAWEQYQAKDKNWITECFEANVKSIDETKVLFNYLASKWRRETAGISSIVHKTILNPTYIKIIKNGDQFLSFILKDLEREPDDWFVALEIITEQNPVPKKDLGYIDKMAEAWVKWGNEKGKI